MKEIIPFSKSVEASPIGLIFNNGASFEEWLDIGDKLRAVEGALQWWIGDWMNYGEKHYGETYAQAIEATGYEYNTLANQKYVAERFEFPRRRGNLPWSHHAEVAYLSPAVADELLEQAEDQGWNRATLRGKVRMKNKELAAANGEQSLDNCVLVGDMVERGREIPDESVDLIFTDPPYPGEYLYLFDELSSLSARVLRPGGLCLSYSGQIHLPEIYRRLGTRLEYFWTFAIRHSGGAQRIFKAGVNTTWKPILGYAKPPMKVYWDSFIDLVSGGKEKELHEWQQAEQEAAYYIQNLTWEGATVLDPFCGSGTTLVAAKKLGRKYIGIEIDPAHAQNAVRRLNDSQI